MMGTVIYWSQTSNKICSCCCTLDQNTYLSYGQKCFPFMEHWAWLYLFVTNFYQLIRWRPNSVGSVSTRIPTIALRSSPLQHLLQPQPFGLVRLNTCTNHSPSVQSVEYKICPGCCTTDQNTYLSNGLNGFSCVEWISMNSSDDFKSLSIGYRKKQRPFPAIKSSEIASILLSTLHTSVRPCSVPISSKTLKKGNYPFNRKTFQKKVNTSPIM